MSFRSPPTGLNVGLQMQPRTQMTQHLTMTPRLEQPPVLLEHGERTRRDILDKFARKPRAKRGRESEKLENRKSHCARSHTGVEAQLPKS